MALVTLKGRTRDESGNPVSGIRVRAYALNSNGTYASTHTSQTFSGSDGVWTLSNLNTDGSQTGLFGVEMTNTTTGHAIWRHAEDQVMVSALVSAGGTAPLASSSITTAMLQNGAATDDKVGNRTVNQSLSGGSSSGSLTQLLSWMARQIKAITGESQWYSTPDISLSEVEDILDDTPTLVLPQSGRTISSSPPTPNGQYKVQAGRVTISVYHSSSPETGDIPLVGPISGYVSAQITTSKMSGFNVISATTGSSPKIRIHPYGGDTGVIIGAENLVVDYLVIYW